MIFLLAAATALLQISGAVSHPATDTGVVYLHIQNTGPSDTLVGAQTSVARSATMHKSSAMKSSQNTSGTIGEMMVPVPSISIPANGAVSLSPGGYHIMLDGLGAPLRAGEAFALRLHFTHAGWIDVKVHVEPY
jgi:periplasmic copper chaperone A